MVIDSYGTLITSEPAPGCYGDSMANTARHVLLTQDGSIRLDIFSTELGFVRHPLSPWREDDTSSDQYFPLMMAADLLNHADVFRLSKKHGTNKSIGTFLVAKGWLAMLGVVSILQALIFQIPIRWSDDNRDKKFVFVVDNDAADYLNYVAQLRYLELKGLSWPLAVALKLTPRDKIMHKVKHYFNNQMMNEGAQVVRAYEDATKTWP